jgi:hypothetical protein
MVDEILDTIERGEANGLEELGEPCRRALAKSRHADRRDRRDRGCSDRHTICGR